MPNILQQSLHDIIPNLKPFNYKQHLERLFINRAWVLINGIAETKSVYIFKSNNTLIITKNDITIQSTWYFVNSNNLIIQTEDGNTQVEAFYKDDDILILNQPTTFDFAFFVNQNEGEQPINSLEDLQDYLKNKYTEKASNLIKDHQFFYISYAKEYGPFSVIELAEKVKNNRVSPYAFVRDINANDYQKRLRIRDLLREL